MALIALVGFWPNYYGPLVAGTLSHPLLIHIHAVVFSGWLALFALQAVFAATKRIQWHLKIGRIGIWYGAALIVLGLTTGVLRSAVNTTEGELLLYVATVDMMMFGGFFCAAIVYRRKPPLHRRMMMIAATSLLVAAASRMTFLPPPPQGLPLFFLIWTAPVLTAMAIEFNQARKVHPVYFAGLGVYLFRLLMPGANTDTWRAFAQWVFGLVR